jgi:hypothetical protein
MPGLVVVNAGRVSEAPVSHRTIIVNRDRLAKTASRHFEVESVDPDQASVEPLLGLGVVGCYGPVV